MENSILKIEDCYEEDVSVGMGANKNTGAFFMGEKSLDSEEQLYHKMEPIGMHLNRLHEQEHGVNMAREAGNNYGQSLTQLEDKWENMFTN